MKVFWDTNVLVDLMSSRRDDHATALRLLNNIKSNGLLFYVSTLSLANADYLLKRHYQVPDFPTRFLTLKNYCHIASTTGQQADLALKSGWPDFEDALQYQSAVAAHCDIIITRDFKGFEQSLITIYSPEQFLEKYSHAT